MASFQMLNQRSTLNRRVRKFIKNILEVKYYAIPKKSNRLTTNYKSVTISPINTHVLHTTL